MKTTLYVVSVDGAYAIEGEIMAPTLKEALSLRKEAGPLNGDIKRIETIDLPIRELLTRVFNRTHYAAKTTTVKEPFVRSGK